MKYWAVPIWAGVLAVLVSACSQPTCVGCKAAATRPTATGIAATTPPDRALGSEIVNDLAQAGIRLRAPTSSAAVSKSAAQRTALLSFPGITAVRQAVLADFSDTHRVPVIDTLAWVVSFAIPPGYSVGSTGPVGNPAQKTTSYLVVFIDAKTGAFIQAAAGGHTDHHR